MPPPYPRFLPRSSLAALRLSLPTPGPGGYQPPNPPAAYGPTPGPGGLRPRNTNAHRLFPSPNDRAGPHGVGGQPVRQPVRRPQQQTAQQVVNALLAQQLSAQTSAEQKSASQQQARKRAILAFTQAMLAALKGVPGEIGGYYDAALSQSDQLARSAAAGLAAGTPSTGDQAALAAINAPEAQRQQLSGQEQAVYAGGAGLLYDVHGAIPGAALAASKAAQQGFATNLRDVIAAQGQQGLLGSL